MSKTRIAFIGAGNMASSLIGGLLAKGLDAAQIRASDPGAETRAKVAAEHGIELFADNAQAIQDADVIVIAVKPQAMKAVCQDLRPHLLPHQLLVSIAAGITCASLLNWLGNQPLVRCMPNTPALLGKGVSGLYATAEVSAEQDAAFARVRTLQESLNMGLDTLSMGMSHDLESAIAPGATWVRIGTALFGARDYGQA